MALGAMITGGIPIATTVLPLPNSVRRKKDRKLLRAEFKREVLSRLIGCNLPEAEYALHAEFYASWYTQKNTIKRAKDLANLVSDLSDDVAKAVGVDDKCFFALALVKANDPEQEFVRLTIYKEA